MSKEYVVHLTPCSGSMQASARIAVFLSKILKAPLLDSPEQVEETFKDGPRHRYATIYFVNGTLAFSALIPSLGDYAFKRTQKLVWIQNDYTIKRGPHFSHSPPTSAVSSFRKNFYGIPEFHLWSTCKDEIRKRLKLLEKNGFKGDPRFANHYVNWNALTYSPFDSELESRSNSMFYYGALRDDRRSSFRRYLDSGFVRVSLSNPVKKTIAAWRELAPEAILKRKVVEGEPPVSLNSNRFGVSPLLSAIDSHKHSIYLADAKSLSGDHSYANRFYEVLSTPRTILWLESGGNYHDLPGHEDFLLKSTKNYPSISSISESELISMSNFQRERWLPEDPYHALVKTVNRIRTI